VSPPPAAAGRNTTETGSRATLAATYDGSLPPDSAVDDSRDGAVIAAVLTDAR